MKKPIPPKELATLAIHEAILPVYRVYREKDPQLACDFAYHIMGNSMSIFAQCVETQAFEDTVKMVFDEMLLRIKKERGELRS